MIELAHVKAIDSFLQSLPIWHDATLSLCKVHPLLLLRVCSRQGARDWNDVRAARDKRGMKMAMAIVKAYPGFFNVFLILCH